MSSDQIGSIKITYTFDRHDRKAKAATRALRQEIVELVADYDGLFLCPADVT